MQLELLTKVFGGGVRDWRVKQGRDVVAGIVAGANGGSGRHTLQADTRGGEDGVEIQMECECTNS
jgi:hypothetical protein